MPKTSKANTESSSSASSGSARKSSSPTLDPLSKGALKAAKQQREENIAKSTAEMGRLAIPAVDTPYRAIDEQAAKSKKETERALERQASRLEYEQRLAKTDLEQAEHEEMIQFMKDNSSDEPRSALTLAQLASCDSDDPTITYAIDPSGDSRKSEDEEEVERQSTDGGGDYPDSEAVSSEDETSNKAKREADDYSDSDDDYDDAFTRMERECQVESEAESIEPKPKAKKTLPVKPPAKKRATKSSKPALVAENPKVTTRSSTSDKKATTSKTKIASTTSRKRKADESDIEFTSPEPRGGINTTALINMKEAFYLSRAVLLADMDGAARSFYAQAHRPGFVATWDSVIETDALQTIRDGLLQQRKLVEYSITNTETWPIINGNNLSLKQVAEDLKKIYFADRRTDSTFDFDQKLRQYRFAFSWETPSVEMASIANFRDIILAFFTTYDAIDTDKQNDICKIFYKKLPQDNKFTEIFMERTKARANTGKKDNIQKMLSRLNLILAYCRNIVISAKHMGGHSFTYKTDEETSSSSSSSSTAVTNVPKVPYQDKPIAKRLPDTTPGTDRNVNLCHTCGRPGHNRFNCSFHMNPHCNRTHTTWKQSPECQQFKEIGHNHFMPNVRLSCGETTKVTNHAGADSYVYPVDEDDDYIDALNASDNRRNNNNRGSNNNNRGSRNNAKSKKNRNDDRKATRNDDRNRNDDRDNDRDTDKDNDNSRDQSKDRDNKPRGYQGKSKSPPPVRQMEQVVEIPEQPMSQNLLSTIISDETVKYLKVYISLPQIPSRTTAQTTTTGAGIEMTVATATPRPTHARRRKTKTRPPPTTGPRIDGLEAMALIDTGCAVGDVVSGKVLRGLHGELHLRTTDTPLWMCSGLDSNCVESLTVLDIVISFQKDFLTYSFTLPVRIAEKGEVDLILGLATIKRLNLVKIIPEFFQTLENIRLESTQPLLLSVENQSMSSNIILPLTTDIGMRQNIASPPDPMTTSPSVTCDREGKIPRTQTVLGRTTWWLEVLVPTRLALRHAGVSQIPLLQRFNLLMSLSCTLREEQHPCCHSYDKIVQVLLPKRPPCC